MGSGREGIGQGCLTGALSDSLSAEPWTPTFVAQAAIFCREPPSPFTSSRSQVEQVCKLTGLSAAAEERAAPCTASSRREEEVSDDGSENSEW